MKTLNRGIIGRVRDIFSSAVLGTTSIASPALSGGLSLASRGSVTGFCVVLSVALAFVFRESQGPLALFFFFPALMIAGIFGGLALTLTSLTIVIAIAASFFVVGFESLLFAFAAIVQATIALLLRELFRESRRWGVRYRTLIDAVTAGVVISDPLGQIERRQPEFEKVIGMKWPDYAGMGWLAAVHPDDLKINRLEPGVRDNLLRRTARLRDPKSGDWRWFQFRSVVVPGREGRPQELISVLFDVHHQQMAQEEREIVAGEMRHRWKNLMTVITALATSSQPAGDAGVDTYVKKLLGRFYALSAAGEQAIASNREIDIGGVVRATLAPFMEESAPRIAIEGPPCQLSEQTGAALALGVHELATNAIKYGALSVPQGSVRVQWTSSSVADGERVTIEWREKDGPPASKPNRESFGTRVIRFIAAREREGDVEIEYRAEGLYCRISFLHEKIEAAADRES